MSYMAYKDFNKKKHIDPQTRKIVEDLKDQFDWADIKKELQREEEQERRKKAMSNFYNDSVVYKDLYSTGYYTTTNGVSVTTSRSNIDTSYASVWDESLFKNFYPNAIKPEIEDDSEEVDFNG